MSTKTHSKEKFRSSRWSLIYVVFYLSSTGLALMLAPLFSLKLLGATGVYEPIFVRSVGVFMVALSMLVAQVVRHKVEVLIPSTIFVRVFFMASFFWLWKLSDDPLFIVIMCVVGLGLILTSALYLRERINSPDGI